MKELLMKTNDICKIYKQGDQQNTVLNHIDVEIYEKDFTIIMGPSGAGKSTLLYILSGLDVPDVGSVEYKGKQIQNLKEKELAMYRAGMFGFIFQQSHLIHNLTLKENVLAAGYRNPNMSEKEIKQRCDELLERMQVDHAANRYPHQVSGGEAQRSAIARAMINQPEIIFADEPTGALNRANSKAVLDLLSDMHRDGQSVVMVTHDMHSAIRATRILYLEDGEFIKELRLPVYEQEKEKERMQELSEWLSALQW